MCHNFFFLEVTSRQRKSSPRATLERTQNRSHTVCFRKNFSAREFRSRAFHFVDFLKYDASHNSYIVTQYI